MSKLYDSKSYVFMKHCNWDLFTPFLGEVIAHSGKVKYNVVHLADNVSHNGDNVILIM